MGNVHRYLLFPILLLTLVSCFSRSDLLDLGRTNPEPDGVIVYSKLAVIRAEAVSNTDVMVYFSEAVDERSAETTWNYSIPNLSVISANRDDSEHSLVQLQTSSQSDITYSLIVEGVRDIKQIPIGSNNRVSFTGYSSPLLQDVNP